MEKGSRTAAPRRVGLEHEFRVTGPTGVLDFRTLIHGLRLGQCNLDPADPNAYRLATGAALTCDGREAEIALAPILVRPGFTDEVRGRADAERRALAGRLAAEIHIEGVSTHLSVSLPDGLTQPVCRLYARTFAPAMMLLLDRRDSPGLLVRPRPGRVELGGEYVVGRRLAAAALFAVGSVMACERAVRGDAAALPPSLAVRLEPGRARFGWYVDRTAFGGDLYATGRATTLRTDDGTITAQQALERAWQSARRALGQLAGPGELALLEQIVSGAMPLPREPAEPPDDDPATAESHRPATAYGSATRLRRRAVAEIAPVMLTWDVCAFLLLDRSRNRRAFAVVPGQLLARFLRELDGGRLDRPIADFLRRPPHGSRPSPPALLDRPRLFDEIGPRLALVAPEYGPDGRPVPPLELLTGHAA